MIVTEAASPNQRLHLTVVATLVSRDTESCSGPGRRAWSVRPSAADRTRCPNIPRYYELIAANEQSSLPLSGGER